jgi:hypothetical protein
MMMNANFSVLWRHGSVLQTNDAAKKRCDVSTSKVSAENTHRKNGSAPTTIVGEPLTVRELPVAPSCAGTENATELPLVVDPLTGSEPVTVIEKDSSVGSLR